MLGLTQHRKDSPTVWIRLPCGRIASVKVVEVRGCSVRIGYDFPPEYKIARRREWLETPMEHDAPQGDTGRDARETQGGER